MMNTNVNRIRLFVRNNLVLIEDDGTFNLKSFMDSTFSVEHNYYQVRRKGKGKYVSENVPLYTHIEYRGTLFYMVPRGLLGFIPDHMFSHIDIEDTSTNFINVPVLPYSEVSEVLQPESGFSLRRDQVHGVLTGLTQKRGLLQYPTGCIYHDNEVLMADGSWVNIKELSTNHDLYPPSEYKVKSYDIHTGKLVDSVCSSAHYSVSSNKKITIYAEDATLTCTKNHPILLSKGEYVQASDIKEGHEIVLSDGRTATVDNTVHSYSPDKEDAYDLIVPGTNNFIVRQKGSTRGVVVHNSGKTEIMSGMLKLLSKYNKESLRALVMVPTSILRTDTNKRFLRYGIDSVTYNDSRMDLSHNVTVAHVSAIINDLRKDPELLKDINVVIKDESQHTKSDTYQLLEKSLPNVEYNLGMTALAVTSSKIASRNLKDYSYDESLIIGSTGPVIVDIPPKYYIDQGILARPVVFQIRTDVDVDSQDDEHRRMWSKVQAEILTSEDRIDLISDIVSKFFLWDRKVLILVNTKRLGNALAHHIVNKYDNMSGLVGLRYGGSNSLVATTEGLKSWDNDVLDDFGTNDIKVMIATSVLDEGVDIKNLDALIMAGSGKSDRRILQRVGRVLRKTKNGRYAYVVDFSDDGPTILRSQSALRMRMYSELIGVDDRYIFPSMSLERLDYEFNRLEGLDGGSD